ncbi:MAG: aldehyde dehydrogenase family protein [Actinomycetia bacterium]|nr:aldehyde dehydrogenase family protein [Actinomycetes bacterium]
MLIGGEWHAATGGKTLDVIDPANEETVGSVPSGSPDDVDRAVAAAAAAFPGWAKTDAEQRAEIVRTACERIGDASERIVDTLVHEQGKPTAEARGELQHFIHGLRYYAELATKLQGAYQPLPSTLGESYGLVIRRPVGVVAAIVPSNYPLTLMGTKVGPALVAGNTVVVKPASTTPLTALIVGELFQEAGLPPGVLNVVTGRGAAIGDALVGHPQVRRVAFTGETETGRRVMEIAGPQLKRATLELGGSDPVIICPDADLIRAAKAVLIGRLWNAGQSCLAGKRVYVFAEVYDRVLEQLLAQIERYEPGEGWLKPEKPKIRIGPVHTVHQRETLLAQVEDSRARGAEILFGGTAPERSCKGYFMVPTLVAEAPDDARVVTEETFGPVLPIFKVADMDEAIARANNTRYGLGSSVWTHDSRLIHRAAHELDTGMTWVNQIHYGYDELPFGGVKDSGIGREHGSEGLNHYTELKSVVVGGLS